jgi:hypothetical protein
MIKLYVSYMKSNKFKFLKRRLIRPLDDSIESIVNNEVIDNIETHEVIGDIATYLLLIIFCIKNS